MGTSCTTILGALNVSELLLNVVLIYTMLLSDGILWYELMISMYVIVASCKYVLCCATIFQCRHTNGQHAQHTLWLCPHCYNKAVILRLG